MYNRLHTCTALGRFGSALLVRFIGRCHFYRARELSCLLVVSSIPPSSSIAWLGNRQRIDPASPQPPRLLLSASQRRESTGLLSWERTGERMRREANGEEGRQQPQPQRGEEEQDEEEEERRQPGQEGPPQQHGHSQRTASRPSSGQQPPPPVTMRNVGYVGKHRLSAAITHLDQELQSLQDELNELDTLEPASAACQEAITSTEGKPDPLLPITSGPENSSWDRWFQRVRSSRSNKWWASKGSDFS